ncbi:hypothetical protein PRIPAC_82522, partial [Pristionchus pacificus]
KMNSDPLPISKNVDTALESVQRVQFSEIPLIGATAAVMTVIALGDMAYLSDTTSRDASYALYLLHWPMVCVFNDFEVEDLKWLVAAMVSCVIFAIAAHLIYERWYAP